MRYLMIILFAIVGCSDPAPPVAPTKNYQSETHLAGAKIVEITVDGITYDAEHDLFLDLEGDFLTIDHLEIIFPKPANVSKNFNLDGQYYQIFYTDKVPSDMLMQAVTQFTIKFQEI